MVGADFGLYCGDTSSLTNKKIKRAAPYYGFLVVK